MKKLFAVLAVSAFLFACNDASTTETETTTDSATVAPVPPTDSLTSPMPIDSTLNTDSTMQ